MYIGYHINPVTQDPHIYDHRVEEYEVEDVLQEPGEDFADRDGTRIAAGQTSNGRYIRVVYVPDRDPYDFFVITAYDMSDNQKVAYRKRRKRKGQ